MPTVDQPHAIYAKLGHLYPDAACELDFTSPLELLVATVLSAQSTDRRVNTVTPTLFARYPDAEAYASADVEELQEIIRPTGFSAPRRDTSWASDKNSWRASVAMCRARSTSW